MSNISIHPAVGVARLGSSPGQFCLAPDQIGGLPFEADEYGNKLGPIIKFKDESGQVRRQGQVFKVYQNGEELTLSSPNVESMEWTAHLANKKAAWYQYSELEGNLLYGSSNSYEAQKVKFRNAIKTSVADRRKLIVDPGPRTVSGKCQSVAFDADIANAPPGYPISFPPSTVKHGTPVVTLGDLRTDNDGRLILIGGFGHAGGTDPLTSYGGSDTWHDDIADGPVYCKVTFKDGTVAALQAWCIVGSPDFAPEIVNISSLNDTMFDVGVRAFNLVPDMYNNNIWNENFQANFYRDIQPIIERIRQYQWVANVQSMSAFFSNIFDFSDPSDSNKENRENYFNYFRGINDKSNPSPDQPQAQLFKDGAAGILPMMPLNSGSNSVSNTNIVKFVSLNETQLFLMKQWAKGSFSNNRIYDDYPVNSMDQASMGNCVGLPMCPGIEVTWSMQNPKVYSSPYVISDHKGPGGYNQTGLDPSRDECEGGGCEPGDLTKRMACPWQADFFQCTIQYVNFSDPNTNKENSVPLPPAYYTYWWPPQSPWDVLTGEITAEGQKASHLPSGQQANYARGINSFVQMVEHWTALAFIRNNNSGDKDYPYFTETERNNELFTFKEVGVDTISGNSQDKDTTIPVFFIENQTANIRSKSSRGAFMAEFLEARAFKAIEVAEGGLGLPRSGTRSRR